MSIEGQASVFGRKGWTAKVPRLRNRFCEAEDVVAEYIEHGETVNNAAFCFDDDSDLFVDGSTFLGTYHATAAAAGKQGNRSPVVSGKSKSAASFTGASHCGGSVKFSPRIQRRSFEKTCRKWLSWKSHKQAPSVKLKFACFPDRASRSLYHTIQGAP